MKEVKTVLNVGGGSKGIPIPEWYSGWDHLLLDIVDGQDVDIVMDGCKLIDSEPDQYDAVYCSHNLEHYRVAEVPVVLAGFYKVIKTGGHVMIRVPHLAEAMRLFTSTESELDDPVYNSDAGLVSFMDIIYGADRFSDEWGHKCGFTIKSLHRALEVAGFSRIVVWEVGLELRALGWVDECDEALDRMIAPPKTIVAPNSVIMAYCHYGSVRQEFHLSVANAISYDSQNGRYIRGEISVGGAYIAHNRNLLVEQFLNTNAEWLWMLDNDVEFSSDLLAKIMEVADKDNKPIVGVVYFTQIDGLWLPVWLEDREGVRNVTVHQITIGEVREIAVTGMGCTLIHRSVLEKMKESFSDDPWHWFGHDIIDGERVGEDVTFCSRAREMGFPVYGFAHPIVHMKTDAITWQTFDNQFRLLEGR